MKRFVHVGAALADHDVIVQGERDAAAAGVQRGGDCDRRTRVDGQRVESNRARLEEHRDAAGDLDVLGEHAGPARDGIGAVDNHSAGAAGRGYCRVDRPERVGADDRRLIALHYRVGVGDGGPVRQPDPGFVGVGEVRGHWLILHSADVCAVGVIHRHAARLVIRAEVREAALVGGRRREYAAHPEFCPLSIASPPDNGTNVSVGPPL